ncbi:MAG: adaptor protein MecA [Lachnospiraceae bacterium]|nr:adaptor protein MecA [Lachnospiraceae bacterium]
MKIEKINDKQIRCTLSSEDLASRQIKLSELAFGTEKAKALFQDMMQQAKTEFGFNADNSPIMVEAVPMAADSIMLIISKVDDPEELDSRFSRFSDAPGEESASIPEKHFTRADDILDLFNKLMEAKSESSDKQKASDDITSADADSSEAAHTNSTDQDVDSRDRKSVNLLQLFHFSTLDGVIEAARGLNHFFKEENSLYKDPLTGDYLLVLYQNSCSPEDFNRVCNILSEYSQTNRFFPSGAAFLNEHMECIIRGHALQTLEQL